MWCKWFNFGDQKSMKRCNLISRNFFQIVRVVRISRLRILRISQNIIKFWIHFFSFRVFLSSFIINIFVGFVHYFVANNFFYNIFQSDNSDFFVFFLSSANFDLASYKRQMIGTVLNISFKS